MRVVVAGAVAWSDKEAIQRELARLPKEAIIIHGDSPGADALARQVASSLGFAVEPMAKSKADYAKYKRAARVEVDERMLQSASLVLIFHPMLEKSRGSKHLAELAQAASIEVKTFAG